MHMFVEIGRHKRDTYKAQFTQYCVSCGLHVTHNVNHDDIIHVLKGTGQDAVHVQEHTSLHE